MSSAYSTSTALSSAVLPRCYDRLPPTLSSSRPLPLQPEPVEVSEKAFQGVTPSFYLSSYQLLLIPYGISPTFLASHGHKSMKCYPHRAMFVRQRVAPKMFSTSREEKGIVGNAVSVVEEERPFQPSLLVHSRHFHAPICRQSVTLRQTVKL